MVLRLLILKHIRNWSYEVLEREVRANLVYRDFTHVGGAKTPDAKTMGRWGLALGPQVLKQVQARIVTIARDKGVTAGRRMRVDTTVVETDIHHPTDSTLLGDGVRVLTRIIADLDERDLHPALRSDLGDPRPHQAAPDHADLPDLVRLHLNLLRRWAELGKRMRAAWKRAKRPGMLPRPCPM